MTTTQKFESTTKAGTSTGNGKLLVISGGKVLTKADNGEKIETELLTGEENALQGIYEGSVPNKFDETKSDQKLRMADGTLVILRETANIRRGFANVQVGELVRVVYGGKTRMTKGANAGKSVHNFDVQRAINAEDAG
jgi:hypothetical protein